MIKNSNYEQCLKMAKTQLNEINKQFKIQKWNFKKR